MYHMMCTNQLNIDIYCTGNVQLACRVHRPVKLTSKNKLIMEQSEPTSGEAPPEQSGDQKKSQYLQGKAWPD